MLFLPAYPVYTAPLPPVNWQQTPMILTLGTRTSTLAMWQTNHVVDLLQTAWPELVCEKRPFTTQGDKTLDKPLPQIGGKGLFTAELESALLRKEIDMAVHSLKDLPVEQPAGVVLGAIVGREDVRDALIADGDVTLGSLPIGAVVGTSSLRRQAQLLEHRPDLQIRSIRGNVETRIDKVFNGAYDATLLAVAGLNRLQLRDRIAQILPLSVMLPAPGQGALAVQCRQGDSETRRLLDAIHQPDVADCVTAERTFLHALGGGCATPVGAFAVLESKELYMVVSVSAVDGSKTIRLKETGLDPVRLGETLADRAFLEGASALLEQNAASKG